MFGLSGHLPQMETVGDDETDLKWVSGKSCMSEKKGIPNRTSAGNPSNASET